LENKIQKTAHSQTAFMFNLIITLVYCAIIFIQSSYPAIETFPKFPYRDKFLHFLGYAFLGILFYRTFESKPFWEDIRLTMAMAMAASAVYGISDEIHQYFVPFREADAMDMAADGIGSIFGVWIYRFVTVRFTFWSNRRSGTKKY